MTPMRYSETVWTILLFPIWAIAWIMEKWRGDSGDDEKTR